MALKNITYHKEPGDTEIYYESDDTWYTEAIPENKLYFAILNFAADPENID